MSEWFIFIWNCFQFDISNFQEKFADLKWAAGKRKKMVESASWPPGDASEAKSFMVSVLLFIADDDWRDINSQVVEFIAIYQS